MRHFLITIIAVFVVAASASTALASGWNDFQLSIDPGFKICRANSLDVDLGRADGSLVYFHGDYPGVGPITGYVVTPTHIFTRHLGRARRNLFDGDTFENVDSSRTFYFVVDKVAANTPGQYGFSTKVTVNGVPFNDRPPDVFGPFDEQTFRQQPVVQAAGAVQWVAPSNPHPEVARAGQRMFVAFMVVLFGGPILVVAFVAGLIVWIFKRGRKVA